MSSIISEVAEMRHEIRSLLIKNYDALKVIMLLCLGVFVIYLAMVVVLK